MKWKKFYEEEAKFKRYEAGKPYVVSFTSGIKFNSLLDVGCGDGWLCKFYKEKGVSLVVGLDVSRRRAKHSIANCSSCHFVLGNVYSLPFKDESVDLVTAIEILEHLEHPDEALKELRRISTKYIIFQVPYNEVISEEICPYCFKNFYPRGHIQSFEETRIEKLCKECDLRILDMDWFFHAFEHPSLRWIPKPVLKCVKALVFHEFIQHGGYIGVLCQKI